MKKLLTTLLFATVMAISYHASAASVNPGHWSEIATSNNPASPTLDELVIAAGYSGTFELLYKAKHAASDNPVNGTGQHAAFYETHFNDLNNDNNFESVDIYFRDHYSSNAISCGDCFLLVKDGKHDPAWYLFDISNWWNGTETLQMVDFWLDREVDGELLTGGSISHVAIYGGVGEVPVPAAAWLFGSGLIGLIAIARRKV